MKVSREKAEENREKVLLAAGVLFREWGIEGVTVAEIMKAAGLTHGAFYGQFKSKEDLVAQSIARAQSNRRQSWMTLIERDKDDPFRALAKTYLSVKHRDSAGNGCSFAALGGELSRSSRAVRQAATKELKNLIESLSTLAPGRSPSIKRKRALAAYSSMLGALLLARIVDEAELSEEILAATTSLLSETDMHKQS
jgi:TetR/AcrR family transcriptional regulator, transcriptional repressor for nem operon